MTEIFWTTIELENGNTAAMAIAVYKYNIARLGVSMTTDSNGNSSLEFESKDKALRHINEINKPLYYKYFGLNYKLTELQYGTVEWNLVFEIFKKTTFVLNRIVEYMQMPWWKRLIRKNPQKNSNIDIILINE